ncbi:MAG: tetratricopeptide repeat protein [Planctomycetia bacterium]|nr:tetratricopeptide repeat protein [Planctomycetia bacterium]
MKNIIIFLQNKSLSFIVTLFIATISFVLLDCSNQKPAKIPVTTKSEVALEYYNDGLLLSEKLRGQEAVYFYLKALAEDNEFAMAYLQMAQVQTTPKLRYKYLAKAKFFINDVSDGEKLLILAAEAGANKEHEKQYNYYNKLIDQYPNDERSQNIYANFLFNLQKYKKAITHYEIALNINPNFSQPYNMLGYSYRRLGDFQQAEIYFKKYIDLIKDDPNPYDSYAELLLKMGKFEASMDYYRKALEIKPDFIASIVGIASNLILLDRHEDACKELERIETISTNPGDLKHMHYAKAVANIDIDNFERAFKELRENISISKSIDDNLALGDDLINLGNVYLMYEKPDDALKYYDKSLEYFERSNISQDLKYYVRRQLFVNAGRVAFYNEDVNTLKKYTEKYKSSAQKTMNPNEIRSAHELTGYIYLLEDNLPKAIYELKQANQQNPIILYLIGTAYEELGDDIDKAYQIYDSVVHFNSLNDMNYAFIRKTALAKLNN